MLEPQLFLSGLGLGPRSRCTPGARLGARAAAASPRPRQLLAARPRCCRKVRPLAARHKGAQVGMRVHGAAEPALCGGRVQHESQCTKGRCIQAAGLGAAEVARRAQAGGESRSRSFRASQGLRSAHGRQGHPHSQPQTAAAEQTHGQPEIPEQIINAITLHCVTLHSMPIYYVFNQSTRAAESPSSALKPAAARRATTAARQRRSCHQPTAVGSAAA